jgi:hypothetical protein
MDASTVYAEIESAKTKETLALAVKHMSKLTESERRSLAELVAQRQAEFSTESHIDMNPELVTREAVDAALIAIQTYAHNPSERAKVEIALAAALPVLLGAKTWRHTKPTEPGAYYVRGFNWGRGELQLEALVQVAWHKFKSETVKELVCNLHKSTSEDDLEAWSPLCDMSDDFEWCGPLYTLPTQDTANEK